MEKVKRIETSSFMLFGRNGQIEPVKKIAESLPRGMKVIYSYYAGNTATYGAVGNGKIVLMSKVVEDCFDGEFFTYTSYMSDKDSRPIEEQYGIGVYYCENEEPFTEEEMRQAEKNAELREKNRQLYQEEKKRQKEETLENLKKEFDYLTLVDRNTKTKVVTDNVRKVLKKNFPTTKFSVRYSSFSGGDDIKVSWFDGPLQEDVEPFVGRFQDSHSDYSGDYWDYNPSCFNNLFGGFKYTFCEREFGEEIINEYTQKVEEIIPSLKGLGRDEWYLLTQEQRQKTYSKMLTEVGNSEIKELHYALNEFDRWFQDSKGIALNWLRRIDLQKPIQQTNETKKLVKTQEKGNYEIVDYSEKAIALIGDTKEIKEQLKELGGRFNPRLSCGAGWIFSKRKETELKSLLNLL